MTSTQIEGIEALITLLPDPPTTHRRRRSPATEALLLAALRKGFTSKDAAKAVGMHPSSVTYWRRQDPEFAAAYRAAVIEGRSASTLQIARKLVKDGKDVAEHGLDAPQS